MTTQNATDIRNLERALKDALTRITKLEKAVDKLISLLNK